MVILSTVEDIISTVGDVQHPTFFMFSAMEDIMIHVWGMSSDIPHGTQDIPQDAECTLYGVIPQGLSSFCAKLASATCSFKQKLQGTYVLQ